MSARPPPPTPSAVHRHAISGTSSTNRHHHHRHRHHHQRRHGPTQAAATTVSRTGRDVHNTPTPRGISSSSSSSCHDVVVSEQIDCINLYVFVCFVEMVGFSFAVVSHRTYRNLESSFVLLDVWFSGNVFEGLFFFDIVDSEVRMFFTVKDRTLVCFRFRWWVSVKVYKDLIKKLIILYINEL